MAMRREISVTEYCKAFETWAKVFDGLTEDDRAIVGAAMAHLKTKFNGICLIEGLCDELREWSKCNPSGRVGLLIYKSCLLDRLIYGGETLRVKPCPLHRGRWSGCSLEPCPEGCSFGSNITGWLPSDKVP